LQGSQAENPLFSPIGVKGYEQFFFFISYWNDKKKLSAGTHDFHFA